MAEVKWSHANDCASWNERESLDLVGNITYTPDACTCGLDEFRKAAAESEQGIARLPDGTLWAIKGRDPDGTDRLCVLAPIPDDGGGWEPPLSAGAGDTP
jgi:hypothetical protein